MKADGQTVRTRWRQRLAFAGAALAAACSSSNAESGADAGPLEPPPAECVLTAPPADWTYPAGPYGVDVGDRFENIVLDDCDGDPVDFGDILGQSELALFTVGAGWCEPCIEETEVLDAEIFRRFCPRGLRVVQALFQDTQSRPATRVFCRDWTERFSLSFPVVIDPLFLTERFFDDVTAQTPVNFLVSRDGVIRVVELGTPAEDLPERIDQLLEEMGR